VRDAQLQNNAEEVDHVYTTDVLSQHLLSLRKLRTKNVSRIFLIPAVRAHQADIANRSAVNMGNACPKEME